jgi:hypothetical protein
MMNNSEMEGKQVNIFNTFSLLLFMSIVHIIYDL